MLNLVPKIIKSFQPHLYKDNLLVASRGNKLYSFSEDLDEKTIIGEYDEGYMKNGLFKLPLYKRVLRQGFHYICININDDIVAAVKNKILFKSKNDIKFKNVFQDFRGSRPLRIEYTQGVFAFGEYYGNPERDSVNIYTSGRGKDWKVAYTFPEGTIRHVHGVLDDPIRRGSWIFTGDEDSESKVWFTNDKFKTLTPIVEGSQAARAVNIIARQNELIIPTDTPRERNYIQSFNLKTKKLEQLVEIPGSAFHAIETDGIMLISTVTEPSEINRTDAATLWGSLDGINWKCICELKKDIFPVNLQSIFRYAEIALTPGTNNTDYITAYGRALKGMDDCILVWEKSKLFDFLKR